MRTEDQILTNKYTTLICARFARHSVPDAILAIHKGFVVLTWFAWCQSKSDSTSANAEMWCRSLLQYIKDAVKSAAKCYRDLIADENVQLNTGIQIATDAGYLKAALNKVSGDTKRGSTDFFTIEFQQCSYRSCLTT